MQVQIKRRIEEGRRKESTPQSSHIIALWYYVALVPAVSDDYSAWRQAAVKKNLFFAYCNLPGTGSQKSQSGGDQIDNPHQLRQSVFIRFSSILTRALGSVLYISIHPF